MWIYVDWVQDKTSVHQLNLQSLSPTTMAPNTNLLLASHQKKISQEDRSEKLINLNVNVNGW